MPEASDDSLLVRFALGSPEAFDILYARYERRIWRYLHGQLRQAELADDVAQEVWFAVVRAAPDYRPSARFATWLFTLAHHRLMDAFRRKRPEESLDELVLRNEKVGRPSVVEALQAEPAAAEPLTVVLEQDRLKALTTALDQLPAEQREALVLQLDGELSVEQIAAVTGSTFETVKSRLRYARERLRRQLEELL